MDFSKYKKSTASVWAGETDPLANGAVTTPIVQSVAFAYTDLDEWHKVATGQSRGLHLQPEHQSYRTRTRRKNPDSGRRRSRDVLCYGHGRDQQYARLPCWGPANGWFRLTIPTVEPAGCFWTSCPAININVTLCDTTDFDGIEAEVAKGCDVLYLETPTNPTLKIVDIARLAAAAKKVGAVTVVDNTFATPINQNPLALGADLVLHSATKFLGGHSDAMGGVLCGSQRTG